MPNAGRGTICVKPARDNKLVNSLYSLLAAKVHLAVTVPFQWAGELLSAVTGQNGWNVGNKSPTQREHFRAGACLPSSGFPEATQ